MKTNSEGLYTRRFTCLPGTYQVSVEVQGFKRAVRDSVVLRVNDTLVLDIELEVGALDQSVTVVADVYDPRYRIAPRRARLLTPAEWLSYP